ncbi:hypothetical protein C8R46DRAFT_1030585 [Mycena filopes]|nr:hypothetical protein C8R46DRAFT_1030585 [Mycena filopes]
MSALPLTSSSGLLASLHVILPPALGTAMLPSLCVLWISQVVIGAAKVTPEPDPFNHTQYYIPGFATLSFAMAEHFVLLAGFDGDDNVSVRESIFQALPLLQYAMVAFPNYTCSPVEAPGYTIRDADPYFYGVGVSTKEQQVQEVLVNGQLAHQFGADLLRYNCALGSQAYRVPIVPSSEHILETGSRPITGGNAVI